MRYLLIPFMALALSTAPAFGDHHEGHKAGDCKCDTACAEKCAKGEGKDCKCDTCDCAKTGKCEHDKCTHHHDDKGAAKKGGAKNKK